MKKHISLLLAAVIGLSSVSLFVPETMAAENVLHITSAEEFIEFSEKCSFDGYSEGLIVELDEDMDLAAIGGKVYIPCFAGTFNGNGHTIKSVDLGNTDSSLAFIRYTTEKACIKDLNIIGSLDTDTLVAGGIVGTNLGTIENCTYEGTIKNKEEAGGIAGKNKGLIINCTFNGTVSSEHRSGGICGYNLGVIKGCVNNGKVNNKEITVESSSVRSFSIKDFDISEVSEDSFYDISDVGGIAGLSEGVVISCENKGIVGYDRMGYNVGGIVGRQCGRLEKCKNSGEVIGRKDVGGIAGQLEPYASWDFSQSKLTVLRSAADDINAKITKLEADAKNSSDNIKNQVASIKGYITAARTDTHKAVTQTQNNVNELRKTADDISAQLKDAVKKHDHKKTRELILRLKEIFGKDNTVIDLNEVFDIIAEIRSEEKEHFDNEHLAPKETSLADELEEMIASASYTKPDTEAIFNDIKNVSDSASDLDSLLHSESAVIRRDAAELKQSLEALSDVFKSTVQNVSEVKTNYRKDISENGAETDGKGIIKECQNSGEIYADNNAGGITGLVAFEVKFDAEDKLQVSDYLLNDANYLIYAVIGNCENTGNIHTKKECAGGIAGISDFGMIENCTASGVITAEGGDHCGGIIGKNGGTVRNSYSRTIMNGTAFIGGIAGGGGKLRNCKAFSYVESGKQNTGSICGDSEADVEGCYFVENNLGGIDGISLRGKAEPLSYDDMIKLNDIPDIFKKITITFMKDEKPYSVVDVPYGGSIEKLPDVPMNGVKYWKWDPFENTDIHFSQVVNGSYVSPRTTISVLEDVPSLLVEGEFYENNELVSEDIEVDTDSEPYDGGELLKALKFSVNDYSGSLKVRMKAEDGGELYIIKPDGKPVLTEYQKDGSYIVFSADNNSSIVYIEKKLIHINPLHLIGAGGALILLFIVVIAIRSVKKKKTSSAENEDTVTEETEKK